MILVMKLRNIDISAYIQVNTTLDCSLIDLTMLKWNFTLFGKEMCICRHFLIYVFSCKCVSA